MHALHLIPPANVSTYTHRNEITIFRQYMANGWTFQFGLTLGFYLRVTRGGLRKFLNIENFCVERYFSLNEVREQDKLHAVVITLEEKSLS